MFTRILTTLALTMSPLAAQAGDPCPISVDVHDLGVPAWLDRDAILSDLETTLPWLGFRHAPHAQGISVQSLHDGSPMVRAGLGVNDIITQIDDTLATDTVALDQIFDTMQPGDVLQVATLMGPVHQVSVGASDPVALGIVQALETVDCRYPTFTNVSSADQARIQPYLYDTNRRFRCDDAHIALQAIHEEWDTAVYVLRGSRRIIIAMPHWGTTCIQASALDGAQHTTAALISTVNQVIDGYIADRHANP